MREAIKKGNRYIRIPDNWHDERIKDIHVYFEERGYVAIFVHRKDVAYIPDLLLYSDTEEPHLIWVEVCDAHNLGKRKLKHLKRLMEKVKGKLIRYFKNYEREHKFDVDIML